MAFTFDPSWDAKGNHAGVPTMTSSQEVEDVIVKICATKTSTDASITALLALIAARSADCNVQKGLHQDELFGAIGAEQHVRIRAKIAAGQYVTFHVYVSILLGKVGRGRKAKQTALIALSSISYYQGNSRISTTY